MGDEIKDVYFGAKKKMCNGKQCMDSKTFHKINVLFDSLLL